LLDRTQALEELIEENLLKQPVWYKLYRAELICDIPFAVGKCHEDVFWSWQVIARAEKVSVFDTPCYFYLQRSGSIMSEQFSRKRLDAMEAECLRHDYLKLHYPALAGQSLRRIYRSCLYLNQLAMRTADKQTQDMVRADSAKIFKKYPLTGETIGILSAKERIWLEMARTNMPLTCCIRNLLGIGT
jgi:hypothetical protein